MTKSKNKKRKDRNSSDNENNTSSRKICKQGGPSGNSYGDDISLREVLNSTNSVLYGEHNVNDSVFLNTDNTDNTINSVVLPTMAESFNGAEPTNRDLMNLLKNVSIRLENVEKKLSTMDAIEKKIGVMENDIKKLWVTLEDKVKRVDERVVRLEDKVDGADTHVAEMTERIQDLERQREGLRDDVSYLQSQTMRNNLIFVGIPENNTNGNESPEVTERLLRQHLRDAFNISQELTDSIRFERVHRSPGAPVAGKVRNVVAKFTYFKDREMVRKRWKELEGTLFRVFEQFPQDVIQERRKLVPKMKEARRQGKRAYLAYDTLYINGEQVRE